MEKQNEIKCNCGYTYFTKNVVSNCPNCGEKNWTAAGILAIVLFIIAIVIFSIFIAGSMIWSLFSLKYKLNKWNSICSLLLGITSIIVFSHFYEFSEYPKLTYLAYILNTLGILFSIYNLIKIRNN
jgi:hypothetical protein